MKHLLYLITLIIFFAPNLLTANDKDIYALKSKALIQNMQDGKFVQATQNFDSTMSVLMPAEKLKEVWASLNIQLGTLESIGETKTRIKGDYYESIVLLTFKNLLIDAKIYYDKKADISGFFLVPHEENHEYFPPSYSDSKSFSEEDIIVNSGETPLKGKICIPKGSGEYPVLILVHGSGPNDMNEMIGNSQIFRDISYGLASRGICVIRYNKRTNTYKKFDKEPITLYSETIEDAVTAVELAKSFPAVDTNSIFILGHSLGGMMIPRIATHTNSVQGYISLAGSLRGFDEILMPQMDYIFNLDGEIDSKEKQSLDMIVKQIQYTYSDKLTENSPIDSLLFKIAAPYWIDMLKYDMPKLAKKMQKALFVLQGGRDYQVVDKDFKLWKTTLENKKNVQYKFYPKLNHLFITGEGKSTPSEYEVGGSFDEEVIIDIISFVNSNK